MPKYRRAAIGPWMLQGKLYTRRANCHVCGKPLVGGQLVYSNTKESIVVGQECVRKFEQQYQNPKTWHPEWYYWKKGDRVEFRSRKGTLVTNAKYYSTGTFGGWYAKIKWDDQDNIESFLLNRIGMINTSKKNPKKVYRTITTFPSKSKPGKIYTVKIDEAGQLSCDCPSWIFKRGKVRDCYHVRVVRSEMKRNPVSLYQSFHGVPPSRKTRVYYEEPKGELLKVGDLSEIRYKPTSPSQHEGVEFYHRSGDTGQSVLKTNLVLATDKQGKNLYLVKKDKKVKRPYFSSRGIIGAFIPFIFFFLPIFNLLGGTNVV